MQEEEDRGRTAITSWPCPEFVRGSDASQFKPGLTPRDALTIFVADIAQPLRLVVNSTVELDGVELLRYWLVRARHTLAHNHAVCTATALNAPRCCFMDCASPTHFIQALSRLLRARPVLLPACVALRCARSRRLDRRTLRSWRPTPATTWSCMAS